MGDDETGAGAAGDDETGGWDPDRYDDGHAFVYEYGADLLDLLSPAPGERVLDLGCGTGHLTAEIADTGAAVVGVDRAAEMVGRARREYPSLPFARADARALPFDRAFDAVLSNAVLHWIDEAGQDEAAAAIHDALVPGGRLVAELGGAGNVDSIAGAVLDELAARGVPGEHPWHFPSLGDYATRLERAGFEVTFARLFDRPTPFDGGEDGLRNWLAMFGDPLLGHVDPDTRAAVVSAVEERLRPERFRDGRWVGDYRRLRLVARRE